MRSDLRTAASIGVALVRSGLRYRLLRAAGRPGKVQALSLEVTHACVCHCRMCNIWKIPETVADLTLEEWVALLSSDLFGDLRELDITGGEPFLRDDLVALVGSVCGLKEDHFPRLRSVAITTNGVLTDRVLRMVEEMLEPMTRRGLELVIVCALDAIGDLHDRIRRYPGAWSRVDRTIAGLVELRREHPKLIVGLKTTVLPENLDRLDEIVAYARERGLFTIVSPAIVTAGRYLNPEKAAQLALAEGDRARLAQFYEGTDFSWSYHARTLAAFLRTGRMKKPCSCGFNYFFVRSTGEMFLCPLFERSVGDLRGVSPAALFSSKEARVIRKRVGRAPECATCTEPGLERYSLPYEGFAYLGMLLRSGPRSFVEQHRHLGLDKYV